MKKIVRPVNMRGIRRIEQWKDLNNFENGKFKGLYKVSSFGRVFSVKNNKILKPSVIKHGRHKKRFRITLYKNGERQICYIHRLVATEFIPNPSNKPCIDHIDTNPKNNRVENLRWCTQQENLNNELTLANMTNGKYIIISYCILDDGSKIGLGVYKGLSQAEREVKSYSENVTNQGISHVLNPKSCNQSCGKIKATANTPAITLAKILLHNLDGKKIFWTYLQDFGGFDLEEYLTSIGIIMV